MNTIPVAGFAYCWGDCAGISFAPGAFEGGLTRNSCRLLLDHDYHAGVFARTADDTFKVWENKVGLAFFAAIEFSRDGARLARFIRQARPGVSFAAVHQRVDGATVSCATIGEISITATPRFQASCCWVDDDQLPAALERRREQWVAGLPDGSPSRRCMPAAAVHRASSHALQELARGYISRYMAGAPW